ncbi:WXG100 family type VII secretion target [Yinghuangia seranimata]|uniref:WXG100 family type VII secretion target n=1 Tax=Yinghuangia seranimata TaxID=408067 RepID=UPI00248B6344|nr:WXG100 family type VII secretion target [Yinghuangia seranimata]MDI2132468.1 WXG100 family type VII secretion target [Yinghuangia seranimata]
MGSPIVVTFAAIEGAAAEIARIDGQIQQKLGDLKREVQRVSGTWEGQAQAEYQQKQQAWDRDQEGMHELILQISKALTEGARVYQETESANAKMWG